jgi:hypothetical protein
MLVQDTFDSPGRQGIFLCGDMQLIEDKPDKQAALFLISIYINPLDLEGS